MSDTEQKPEPDIFTIFVATNKEGTEFELGGYPIKGGFVFVSRSKLPNTTEWVECDKEKTAELQRDFAIFKARAAYGEAMRVND